MKNEHIYDPYQLNNKIMASKTIVIAGAMDKLASRSAANYVDEQ